MTTIVLSEATARGCFPIVVSPEFLRDNIPPSVRWLVVDSPLVCETCGGSWYDQTRVRRISNDDQGSATWADCLTCNGTGLPPVEIVSQWFEHEPRGMGQGDTTIHGTVTIGPAVPITMIDAANAPYIFIGDRTSNVWLVDRDRFPVQSDITDQFGDQDITPGRFAHPIVGVV